MAAGGASVDLPSGSIGATLFGSTFSSLHPLVGSKALDAGSAFEVAHSNNDSILWNALFQPNGGVERAKTAAPLHTASAHIRSESPTHHNHFPLRPTVVIRSN